MNQFNKSHIFKCDKSWLGNMTEECTQKKVRFALRKPSTVDLEIKSFLFWVPIFRLLNTHSKELARWLGDLFSMSLRLPDSQGVVSICSRPPRGRRRVACFYVVENYQTNLHVTVLTPGEQTYWGRMLSVWKWCPGAGPAGQRGWHFFRSLSRWLSVGLPCLKRELEIWGEPNFVAGGQTSFIQMFRCLLLRGDFFHLFLPLPC